MSEIHRKKRKRRERSQSKVNENQRKAEDGERILSVRETKMKEQMQRDQKEWTKEEGFDYHLVDNRKIIKKQKWLKIRSKTRILPKHTPFHSSATTWTCMCAFIYVFIYLLFIKLLVGASPWLHSCLKKPSETRKVQIYRQGKLHCRNLSALKCAQRVSSCAYVHSYGDARLFLQRHMSVRMCVCFFSPPLGRPHAPSVSDWFGIHCHRETGKTEWRRWGGGRRREGEIERQQGDRGKGESIFKRENKREKGVVWC